MNTGRIVLDLAPTKNNPRNSEGSFIETKTGLLRFFYSRFEDDNWHDDANACIAEITSADRGETWSEPRIHYRAADCGAKNLMSVSLVRLSPDEIGLFYLVRISPQDTRLVLRRSRDEGETWSGSTYCMDDLGYHVVNNDRVVKLSSGRLIAPAAIHPPGPDTHYAIRMEPFDVFYLSDDNGVTFRQSSGCVAYYTPQNTAGMQEPGVVELPSGILWGYSRTTLGRHYEYFSLDGGENWTQAQPSQFTAPASPLQIKRSPYSGRYAAVWNPIPNYQTRELSVYGWGRTPLVYAISDGEKADGDHADASPHPLCFGSPVVIEDEPDAGFCYPAIHFLSDAMLLAYCAGGSKDGSCLNRLRIRKIPLNE